MCQFCAANGGCVQIDGGGMSDVSDAGVSEFELQEAAKGLVGRASMSFPEDQIQWLNEVMMALLTENRERLLTLSSRPVGREVARKCLTMREKAKVDARVRAGKKLADARKRAERAAVGGDAATVVPVASTVAP